MGLRSLKTFKAKWSNVDRAADPQEYVRMLDAVRPVDDAAAYANLLSVLEVREGDLILDVACGTDGLTRVLAAMVGNAGRIVGTDKSASMIAAALSRSDNSNLPVEYHVADAHSLPFPADLFDSCCSIGTFEIVDDPSIVLPEMHRVTRPGGQICVQCGDSGTTTIDASNKAVTRSILDYACDFEGNGWLGRQLPRLFAERGVGP